MTKPPKRRTEVELKRHIGPPGTNVKPFFRFYYGSLDAMIYSMPIGVMTAYIGILNLSLFQPMQRYSRQQFHEYAGAATFGTIIVIVVSIFCHLIFSGSIGKRGLGCKTVKHDGRRMSWLDVLKRALFCWSISLMILAPGPTAALLLGPGRISEATSFTLLAVGLAVWVLTMMFPYKVDGEWVTFHERFLGLKTIYVGPKA